MYLRPEGPDGLETEVAVFDIYFSILSTKQFETTLKPAPPAELQLHLDTV